MSSIIEGFEYDIFISYRQKDNRYDGWVTEFVDNLKKELETTFKEDISVYFDINPHDGLLETHDVSDSLKEKLNCLIFIPIISRTYCDPNSFAWEHEFKAFVERASKDQFGLKVKLPNGNIASRVLPIRIYDLDSADVKLCESVIGGILRGVDFIYSEPGVNRPLKSDDDEKTNLNKTKYRNQINKAGNAIKEVISGLIAGPIYRNTGKIQNSDLSEVVKKNERINIREESAKVHKKKLLTGIIIIVAVLVLGTILAYPRLFKRNTFEKLRSSGRRISIAVIPFQNMTNDTILNIWQDGIQNELITYLTNSEELKVRQTESMTGLLRGRGITNYATITPLIARAISQKLDADVFIYGSIKQAGSSIRVNAQLIDSKTEEIFKSFQIDGNITKILSVIDTLSEMVKDYLIMSNLRKGQSNDLQQFFSSTNSADAYRYFIYGNKAFSKGDWTSAASWYMQSIKCDSSYIPATVWLSITYLNLGLYEQGKKLCLMSYQKRDQLPIQQKIWANLIYAGYFQTTTDIINWTNQLIEIDDQQPLLYYILGGNYTNLKKYDEAVSAMEKSLKIYDKWDSKPYWVYNYVGLGYVYHKVGKYNEEERLYKKAEKDFPDDPDLIYCQAILSLTESDTIAANRYIKKLKAKLENNSASEADIASVMASIYSEAGILNMAEKYFRQALFFEPEKVERIYNLGFFLINKDQNINEGLDLIDSALKISPDNYSFLDTKGWGLYKQGKNKEALEILENSWDLRLKNAVYNHEAFLHLEAAKKAVAMQKNN